MTDAERITGLLEANTALVEARRDLATKVATRDAIIDALGRALVEAKQRRDAAEGRAQDAASQALRMLPARIEAERQRDAAQAALRTLHAAIGGIVGQRIETFTLTAGDTRLSVEGEHRFALEADVRDVYLRLAALLPQAAAPDAAPVTTNG